MATPKFMLVWITWARGVDLPPVSPQTALKNHPSEFVAMFLQMAHVLQATVDFVPPVLPSHSHSEAPSVSKSPASSGVEQLEMFGPWETIQ